MKTNLPIIMTIILTLVFTIESCGNGNHSVEKNDSTAISSDSGHNNNDSMKMLSDTSRGTMDSSSAGRDSVH